MHSSVAKSVIFMHASFQNGPWPLFNDRHGLYFRPLVGKYRRGKSLSFQVKMNQNYFDSTFVNYSKG